MLDSEAPTFVSGLEDLAMVGEPVEQSGGHLRVVEDGWTKSAEDIIACRLRALDALDEI